MTTHVEILTANKGWQELQKLYPSQSYPYKDYRPDGDTQYVFHCSENNKTTTVQRRVSAEEVRNSQPEIFNPQPKWVVEAILHDGEQFNLPIVSQNGINSSIRVVHRDQLR